MQRLAGGFLVKRSVMAHIGQGNISELYELPNGQWQFGKGKDAKVVTGIEDVDGFDDGTKADVQTWLNKVKATKQTPVAMQAGGDVNINTEGARARMYRTLEKMSDEVVTRLLHSVEQTLGPIADSMTQPGQMNSHSDGYGDPDLPPPGSSEVQPFHLPSGAKWAQEGNPSAGYLTQVNNLTDDKGYPVTQWHPTPEFHQSAAQADTGSTLDGILPGSKESDLEKELAAARGTQPPGRRAKARR